MSTEPQAGLESGRFCRYKRTGSNFVQGGTMDAEGRHERSIRSLNHHVQRRWWECEVSVDVVEFGLWAPRRSYEYTLNNFACRFTRRGGSQGGRRRKGRGGRSVRVRGERTCSCGSRLFSHARNSQSVGLPRKRVLHSEPHYLQS